MNNLALLKSVADLLFVARTCWLAERRRGNSARMEELHLVASRSRRCQELERITEHFSRVVEIEVAITQVEVTLDMPNRDERLFQLRETREQLVNREGGPRSVAREPHRFDLTRAQSLLRASEVAYEDRPSEIKARLNARSVEDFSVGSVTGYIAQVGNDTVLAFRGSCSLKHWLTNFDFAQARHRGGRVHWGFATALDRVWDKIRRQVHKQASRGPIWVTGHSLGGALAILAGDRLADEGTSPAGVYTFGAPRVGDDAFAGLYRVPLYRVENADDLVCHLPPSHTALLPLKILVGVALGVSPCWNLPAGDSYVGTGYSILIERDGRLVHGHPLNCEAELDRLRGERLLHTSMTSFDSLLTDHFIANYVEQLGRVRL